MKAAGVPCAFNGRFELCVLHLQVKYWMQAQQLPHLSEPQGSLQPCWNALDMHSILFQSAKFNLTLSPTPRRMDLPPDLWLKVAARLQYREVFLLSASNKTLHQLLSAASLVVVNHCSPPADCGLKHGRLYRGLLRNASRITAIRGWKELLFSTWDLQPSLLHKLRVLHRVRLRLEQAALLPGCLSELSCIFEPLGPSPPGLGHRQHVHLLVLGHLTQLTRLTCFSESNGFGLSAAVMWGKLDSLILATKTGEIVLSPEWQAPKLQWLVLYGSPVRDDPGLYFHPAYFPRLVHAGLAGLLVQHLESGLPSSMCSFALGLFKWAGQPEVTHLSGIRLLEISYARGLLVLPANLEVLLLKDADVSLDSRLCKLKLQIIIKGSRLSWARAPPGESQVDILHMCADKKNEWVDTHFWIKMGL